MFLQISLIWGETRVEEEEDAKTNKYPVTEKTEWEEKMRDRQHVWVCKTPNDWLLGGEISNELKRIGSIPFLNVNGGFSNVPLNKPPSSHHQQHCFQRVVKIILFVYNHGPVFLTASGSGVHFCWAILILNVMLRMVCRSFGKKEPYPDWSNNLSSAWMV